MNRGHPRTREILTWLTFLATLVLEARTVVRATILSKRTSLSYTPESENAPHNLHAWKPDARRHDLEHQIILEGDQGSLDEQLLANSILGIIPTIYPHVKMVLIFWRTGHKIGCREDQRGLDI